MIIAGSVFPPPLQVFTCSPGNGSMPPPMKGEKAKLDYEKERRERRK